MLDNLRTLSPFAEAKGEYPAALNAARDLFKALAANHVRYCHWKSNLRLEQGLLGKTDLDLLVDTSHMGLLRRILAEQDIKPVLAPPGKRYPGIEDWLGFDTQTGRLFHLHVHYRLVLGEQFVKNYHIPLEEQFLNSAVSVGGLINIPAPELELAVLSLRALLKYRDRDAVKDILSIRSPGLPHHIRDELGWLAAQTSPEKMRDQLSLLSNHLPVKAIQEFLEIIASRPRHGWKFLGLRRQVRRSLRRYQRHDRLAASLRYFAELWRRQVLPHFTPSRGMTLPQGGLTISLVGVDGSGKTTISGLLKDWLGWRLDVHRHYLGSKEPSRLSAALYLAFRLARRSQTEIGKRLGNSSWLASRMETLKNFFLYCHHLSTGRDRYRRFLHAREQARLGSIAIFDRFPYEAPLDGPEIQVVENGKMVRFFALREQELYSKFTPAELILLLKVSLETSQKRKPDHKPEAVQKKAQTLDRLEQRLRSEDRTNWDTQDANLPLEEVLLQLKRRIWSAL